MDEGVVSSEGGSPQRIKRHLLLQWLLAGVVIAVAVGVGVYVGLTQALDRQEKRTQREFPNQNFLEAGELFPSYTLWDVVRRDSTSMDEIVSEGPVVLLFMSPGCSACRTLATYFEKRIEPHLRADIQILCIFDERELDGVDSGELLWPGRARTLVADRASQVNEDGISAFPTLVALDGRRVIRIIATGIQRSLDAEVLNRTL